MVSRSEGIQEIERLTRSPSRLYILDELRTNSKMERAELERRIGVSRTTIQRNLDELVKRGWLEEEQREYSINPCGELIVDGFDELLCKVDNAKRLQPFFKWAPESEFEFDIDRLLGAKLTTSTPGDPYAPVNEHAEGIADTGSFHALLPSIGLDPLNVARRRTVEENASHEIILSRSVAEIIEAKSEYSEVVDELVHEGNARVFVAEGTPPYYLGILDETVQIGVEDDDGLPRALLETDSQRVREWAREKYDRYKAEAEAFT